MEILSEISFEFRILNDIEISTSELLRRLRLKTDNTYHLDLSQLSNTNYNLPKSFNKIRITTVNFITKDETRKNIIPLNLEYLPYLTKINLKDAKLREFPSGLLSLKNLMQLDISYNQIDKLPIEISILRNLVRFNLSRSKITWVPRSLSELIS